MAIGPFLERLDIFDDVSGYNLNRLVDFLNSITDYSGSLTLGPTNSHLVLVGPVPTLGAIKAGIASQSIVGTDSCHIVTITTAAASPPAPNAILFNVVYSKAWGSAPATIVTENGTEVVWAATASNSTTGYSVFHGGTGAGVASLNASTTYKYACLSIGAGQL